MAGVLLCHAQTCLAVADRSIFETYQRACNNRDIHGFDGPIKVSFGNCTYPVMQDFLRAAESQGFPVTDDLQDLKTG